MKKLALTTTLVCWLYQPRKELAIGINTATAYPGDGNIMDNGYLVYLDLYYSRVNIKKY